MTGPHTRRCISIPCGKEVTIESTGSDGAPVTSEVIDDVLHAVGWREGFCPDCTGLGPKQSS